MTNEVPLSDTSKQFSDDRFEFEKDEMLSHKKILLSKIILYFLIDTK